MKSGLTIILLTLIIETTVGQNKTLTTDSDTVFWFREYEEIRSQIGLEPTDKINSEFYFRLWNGINVIELKQVDGKLIGTVTYLLQQYKRNKVGRLYFKKTELTLKTTEEINTLVNKFKILELPTDKRIGGWEMGLDGITYIIETADKMNYSFKNYWTPEHYKDKLAEAKQLTDFLDELNKIEELNSIGKKFMERQPFSSWYNFIGSATIVSKVY